MPDTSPSPSKPKSSLQSHRDFRFRLRMFTDKFMRYAVAFGGISIIIAITLIFLYLLMVVFPIFKSAEIENKAEFEFPVQNSTLYLAMEEQNEVGLHVDEAGKLTFFNALDGKVIHQQQTAFAKDVKVTSFAHADPNRATIAFGLSNGHAVILQHKYKVSYPDNKRLITPEVINPMNETILVDTQDVPLSNLAVQNSSEGLTLAAATEDKRLLLVTLKQEETLLGDGGEITRTEATLPYPATEVTHLIIDKDQRELYVASQGGNVTFFDIQDKAAPKLLQHLAITDAEITAIESLTGGISLLIGTSDGRLSQWSLVRHENNQEQLVKYREFDRHRGRIMQIIPEYNRKGFVAIDDKGYVGIYHTTAERTVLKEQLAEGSSPIATISPRASALLLLQDEKKLTHFALHNEHPEISWSSLWGKVWYESYQKPEYIWQSSSASNDFEPKFSLVPISFGTLKAAFYAMLVAVPLAIMGAVFTAQFMSPKMRTIVKPSVEIMEALPTVILGFLAGLWLAPYVEKNLLGIFLLLLTMPFGIILAAYTWQRMPQKIRFLIPDGWEGALLIPAVILIAWVTLTIGPIIELAWFGGDVTKYGNYLGPLLDSYLYIIFALFTFPFIYQLAARTAVMARVLQKITNEMLRSSASLFVAGVVSLLLGLLIAPLFINAFFDGDAIAYFKDASIEFDQRNSVVVGLAMGFAVIPTIFSIAEDALFAVPKHLINGSLALGATPWQTLMRVVLLTASPGIFSAVMIGLGRAVGETMIVLMATGNTPVMDFSIFQGLRTLSANIAVEMPESEVDSTHYRVLFLAALVLFAFTFLFNTMAEIVRQRLRRKYSSL